MSSFWNPNILCCSYAEQFEVSECARPHLIFRPSSMLLSLSGLDLTPILPLTLLRLNLGIIFSGSFVSLPKLGIDAPPMNSHSPLGLPLWYNLPQPTATCLWTHKSVSQGSIWALALGLWAKNCDYIFKVLDKKQRRIYDTGHICPTKPKIFSIWSSIEKNSQFLR